MLRPVQSLFLFTLTLNRRSRFSRVETSSREAMELPRMVVTTPEVGGQYLQKWCRNVIAESGYWRVPNPILKNKSLLQKYALQVLFLQPSPSRRLFFPFLFSLSTKKSPQNCAIYLCVVCKIFHLHIPQTANVERKPSRRKKKHAETGGTVTSRVSLLD